MMLTILKKVLELAQFKNHEINYNAFDEIQDGFFAVKKDKNYYLIIEVQNLRIFLKKETDSFYGRLHQEIVNMDIYDESMDKNLSLIIIQKTPDESSLDDYKQDSSVKIAISNIEENPYFFKKHVFLFTNEEFSLLNDFLNKYPKRSLQHLAEKLSDVDDFNNFKTKTGDFQLTAIIARLFIKFPFLELNITPNTMDSLMDTINMNLKDLKEFKDVILTEKWDKDDSLNQLIEKLNKI